MAAEHNIDEVIAKFGLSRAAEGGTLGTSHDHDAIQQSHLDGFLDDRDPEFSAFPGGDPARAH